MDLRISELRRIAKEQDDQMMLKLKKIAGLKQQIMMLTLEVDQLETEAREHETLLRQFDKQANELEDQKILKLQNGEERRSDRNGKDSKASRRRGCGKTHGDNQGPSETPGDCEVQGGQEKTPLQ